MDRPEAARAAGCLRGRAFLEMNPDFCESPPPSSFPLRGLGLSTINHRQCVVRFQIERIFLRQASTSSNATKVAAANPGMNTG
jgi:hypothetical protein